MNKRGQLELLMNWFMAMVLIFGFVIFFMVWVKPWQEIDNKITPQIDDSAYSGDTVPSDLLPQIRRNQAIGPILMIVGVLGIAIMSSLRRDPNRPYL